MKTIYLKRLINTVTVSLLLLLPLAEVFAETDGDWRRGRIYYRTTCTSCHKVMTGAPISPSSRTIAQWTAYLDADRHDLAGNTNPSVKYFVSRAYRETVKKHNRVAAKLIDLKDETLLQDIRAFLIHGAKDSDTPTRCR